MRTWAGRSAFGAAGALLALLLGSGELFRIARAGGGDREEMVRKDRERVTAGGFWIYNDLAAGFAEANATGRPMVVALRCIPCEECVKLDEDLVESDARLRSLLERFVRVRLVSTNGLDLSLFQFDTDQSFALFLLRADGTIYGRFGTRSDRAEWADDVSVEGLAAALEGALEMHAAWPRDEAALAGKRGRAPAYATPERFPTLRDRYKPALATEGKVVPSCIHCHQIGEAMRAEHLAKKAMPEEALFPYPHPKALGLVLDPARRAAVKSVEPGSAAFLAGFRAGDEIESLAGQPPLSIADLQWVLHGVPASGGRIAARVRRGEGSAALTLVLRDGWRRADDIEWRASTWPLRGLALGGLKLERVPAEDPALAEVPASRRAAVRLRVAHVGQYAPHDRARRAGFRKGDLILSFDGRTGFVRETDLLRHAIDAALRGRSAGAGVEVVVQRGAETLTLRLPPAP